MIKEAMMDFALARQKYPRLESLLTLYEELLNLQTAIRPPAISVPGREKLEKFLDEGRQLLSEIPLQVDVDQWRKLWDEICNLMARYRPEDDDAIEAIKRSRDGFEPSERVEDWLKWADAHKGNELFGYVFTQALRPFLWPYRDALQPLLDKQQGLWLKGYCPVCGNPPDLGYLDPNAEGALYLVCSACDTRWRFRRLECPFCGNNDHRKLRYYPDETGGLRLHLCDKCQSYLKVIDKRKTHEDWEPVIWRVLTVSMDIAAGEKGATAHRPWGIW